MTMVDEAEANGAEVPTAEETRPEAPDSPGKRLQQARQARKLETSYVATALRLSPTVVEAIERDDYASLPSAVFVSGYIRSYARLLGLDPGPLNQRFHALHPNAEAPPPHVARPESTLSEHDGGGQMFASLVAILVVVALAAGAYGWWVTRPSTDPITDGATEPLADASSALEPDGSTSSPGPGPEVGSELGSELAEPPPARDPDAAAGVETPAAADPVLRASRDVELITRDDAQPASLETEGAMAPTALPTPASPEDEPSTARRSAATAVGESDEAGETGETDAETEDDQATTDPAGPEAVQLAFNGPCWVDIRDSAGKVLLFGEMADGDRERIEGTPPYSLVLGNAAAVELTVGDTPFDLRAIARGNVARFELDPAEISARSTDATD